MFDAAHAARAAARRRGQGHRPAHRPSRRALRARRILPAAAGGRGPRHARGASCPTSARRSLEALAAHYRAAAAANPARPRRGRCGSPPRRSSMPRRAACPTGGSSRARRATTFSARVNGLFVDRALGARDDARSTGASRARRRAWRDETYDAKRLIMQVSMASEINQLGHHLDRISERNRLFRDFTLPSLARRAARGDRRASPSTARTSARTAASRARATRRYIEHAVAAARRRNPHASTRPCSTSSATPCSCAPPRRPMPEERASARHFAMRFQQITGPVTAKGVEDTAHYRYNRLVSLNEVGRRPRPLRRARRGLPRQERRAGWRAGRTRSWPRRPTTPSAARTCARASTSSPRCRRRGARRCAGGARIARRFKREVDGRGRARSRTTSTCSTRRSSAPGPRDADEPARRRSPTASRAYMEKATKEAKVHTSWVNPNPAYDARGARIRHAPARAGQSRSSTRSGPFRRRRRPRRRRQLAGADAAQDHRPGHPGPLPGLRALGSLAGRPRQSPAGRLRAAASALDDLAARIAAESPDASGLATELLAAWPDGLMKLYVIHRALTLRRDRARLFGVGAYVPLAAVGARAEHVVAFARRDGREAAIVAVPRLTARLTGLDGRWPLGEEIWGETGSRSATRSSPEHTATGSRGGGSRRSRATVSRASRWAPSSRSCPWRCSSARRRREPSAPHDPTLTRGRPRGSRWRLDRRRACARRCAPS